MVPAIFICYDGIYQIISHLLIKKNYICRTMKSETLIYKSPDVTVISLETEQYLLIGSGSGRNEGLYDDVNDYSDFFE